MKPRLKKLVRFLCLLCLPIWAVTPWAAVQASAELGIQMYAGLSITGVVGTVYSIQYTTDLAQTSAWRCLALLQLPSANYLWTDTSSPATERRFYRAVADVRTNLVFIPPGTFRMGSPANELDRFDNEGPQTDVTITRGFWMGKYEVTQGEYQSVTGTNPSFNNGDRSGPPYNDKYYGTDLARPVEFVSWIEAASYCTKRTQQETASGSIPSGTQYRLPTAAEWEYACRAWTSTRFSYGDDPDYTDLINYAWYGEGDPGGTHPVGQKLPNRWGLYDMPGNAWEWCRDWYGPYPGGSITDPRGPLTGSERVFRGGSNYPEGTYCRSAQRGYQEPSFRRADIGFRVVLAAD